MSPHWHSAPPELNTYLGSSLQIDGFSYIYLLLYSPIYPFCVSRYFGKPGAFFMGYSQFSNSPFMPRNNANERARCHVVFSLYTCITHTYIRVYLLFIFAPSWELTVFKQFHATFNCRTLLRNGVFTFPLQVLFAKIKKKITKTLLIIIFNR